MHSETAYFIPFGFLILFFFILCTEIKFGLRNLLKTFNTELVKNKTAEQYLFNRDAGDRNYVLEVMVPTLLCKYYSKPFFDIALKLLSSYVLNSDYYSI